MKMMNSMAPLVCWARSQPRDRRSPGTAEDQVPGAKPAEGAPSGPEQFEITYDRQRQRIRRSRALSS